METNFIETDGGRETAGYGWETNDCAVRALAVACRVEYDKAHKVLRRWGRRNRDGFKLMQLLEWRYMFGNDFEWMPVGIRRNVRVEDFLRLNPKGTFILHVRGHFCTVVDGVLYDEARELAGNKQIFSVHKLKSA
jgi:hypothetical protein